MSDSSNKGFASSPNGVDKDKVVNLGFATNPIIHKFLSAKGGRVRKPKGLAKLSPERRREIAILGGRKGKRGKSLQK